MPRLGPTLAIGALALWATGCPEPPPSTEPEPTGAAAPPTAGPAPKATADPTAAVAAAEPTEPPNPDAVLDVDTAVAETQRILSEVSASRNLPVTGHVKVDVMSREAIREFAKSTMYEDTTREELQLGGRIEASLGKMPVGIDPERIYLDLLEDGVLGLYDPKRETLFIGDFVTKGMLSMVVGHEIAHGLQDMHFDLEKHQEPMRHRNDEATARRFLIEGGAQAAYFAWVSGEEGLEAIGDDVLDAMANQVLDLASLASEHAILARSLQMPYTDGTSTVARLVRQKGWEAVDALYQDLPDSSEQMLHLDKLLRREAPIEVTLDQAPVLERFDGLQVVWHDSLGEADLLAMVSHVHPSKVARKACAGWGGDYYLALDREDDPLAVPVVVAVTVWDSKDDAEEFEDAFGRYLRKQATGGTFMERKGDTIVFGTGVPGSVDPNMAAKAAWKAVQRAPAGKAKAKGRSARSKKGTTRS